MGRGEGGLRILTTPTLNNAHTKDASHTTTKDLVDSLPVDTPKLWPLYFGQAWPSKHAFKCFVGISCPTVLPSHWIHQ